MPRDAATALDVVLACEKILRFCDGVDDAGFAGDEKLQSAVYYQVAVIGEAVTRLTPELKQRHPDIP